MRRVRWTGAGIAAALLAGLGAAPLDGQESPRGVAVRCAASGPPGEAACYRAALALQAARAGIGLAAAGGADLPGTHSTLGRRTSGGAPRLTVALRAGLTRAPVPADGGRETASIPGVRGAVGVGIFDGFRLLPTVGGVLSFDLFVDGVWVRPSDDDDFAGSPGGFGVGARVGLVRESFSLPSVTVTATRRWLGDATYGVPEGEVLGTEGADFETVVTSLRGVVGKDFFAWGLLGGVGWDRYEGGATTVASTSEEITGFPVVTTTTDADDLRSQRVLFFGGLSFNVLVLQLSGEAGWARGFDDEPPEGGDFDPSDGTFWASVGLRLWF